MPQAKKRTTERVKTALLELLNALPLSEISVTALCDAAEINRATFYYHYDSVRDVFAELETGLEKEFRQTLAASSIKSDGTPEKSFYVMLFEFVARNATICKIILDSPHVAGDTFISRAMESGRYKVTATMTRLYPDCPAAKIEYYYMFVSNGFLGLLRYWLSTGMRETVEKIAAVGEEVSYLGIKYLE